MPYHCVPELNCKSAKNNGPKLLHGTYGRFIGNKGDVLREPSFELLFNTMDKVIIEYDFLFSRIENAIMDLNVNSKSKIYFIIRNNKKIGIIFWEICFFQAELNFESFETSFN